MNYQNFESYIFKWKKFMNLPPIKKITYSMFKTYFSEDQTFVCGLELMFSGKLEI